MLCSVVWGQICLQKGLDILPHLFLISQLWPPCPPLLSNTPNSFLPQGLCTYCDHHWTALPLSWHGKGHTPLRPQCKHCGRRESPHSPYPEQAPPPQPLVTTLRLLPPLKHLTSNDLIGCCPLPLLSSPPMVSSRKAGRFNLFCSFRVPESLYAVVGAQ